MMRSVRPPWLAAVIALLCVGCSSSEPIVQRTTMPNEAARSTHPGDVPDKRGPSGPPMAPRVQAEARFVNDELEVAIFDKQLLESGLVPIELSIALRDGSDPISFHRDGISAVFLDGTSITAIEPLKTQELVTRFARLVPFGAGNAADEITHLTSAGDKVEGLVFFQSPSMPRATPETLTIELIDEHSGHVEKLLLRIREAQPMPDD